uniref:Uncharacterized protein n=1 Tax=Solanum lycopersicum TaxID=4081 RepID=A0A3Q7FWC3_SOLLC
MRFSLSFQQVTPTNLQIAPIVVFLKFHEFRFPSGSSKDFLNPSKHLRSSSATAASRSGRRSGIRINTSERRNLKRAIGWLGFRDSTAVLGNWHKLFDNMRKRNR